MKSVYKYSDYRKFIKDYYETNKSLKPGFSLRYLSEKAGINSSAFFKFIIEGKRNLSRDSILKTCIALDLDGPEAEYFELLVLFNQAKTIEQKNRFFDQLVELQNLRDIDEVKEDRYAYFAKWYHCVVRELVCRRDFGGDFAKLGRILVPHISAKQARNSVNLLLRLGFLKVVDGKYIQSEPQVSSGYGVNSHHIMNFQIKMLNLAVEAFDRFSAEEDLTTSSSTLCLSKKNFQKFLEMNREFRSRVLSLQETEGDPEEVYQLNVNLFPLSRTRKK